MSGMQLVSVVVPAGVQPGQQMTIQTATGKQAKVIVPAGAAPGSMFRVRLPAEAPTPQNMQQAAPPPVNPNAVQVKEADESDKDAPVAEAAFERTTMEGAPDPKDLYVFAACCCTVTSCYCNFPKCVSGYQKGVVMCCEAEALCCQPGQVKGSLCKIYQGECECIRPYTCCKEGCQLCCLDTKCAFPCDEEVPCMIAYMGILCVKDYECKLGCCVPIIEADDKSPMMSTPSTK